MLHSITLTTLPTPEGCDPASRFVLDNGTSQSMISVDIILQCLRIAEHQGDVPPLPDEWWHALLNRYNVRMDINEHIQTADH